jgi:hypothetical protein
MVSSYWFAGEKLHQLQTQMGLQRCLQEVAWGEVCACKVLHSIAWPNTEYEKTHHRCVDQHYQYPREWIGNAHHKQQAVWSNVCPCRYIQLYRCLNNYVLSIYCTNAVGKVPNLTELGTASSPFIFCWRSLDILITQNLPDYSKFHAGHCKLLIENWTIRRLETFL